MLDLLALYDGERRVAVLGEMRELGERSAELHRELGLKAAATGVGLLVGVGGDAREMVAASGLGSQRAFFYSDADEAGEALAAMLRPGDRALFKGSRGVGLERALERVLKGLEG
jgi:UDP-N-acetylmuramoyl-tripeptide--D-alanyl-D-alanine ligase